MGGNEAKIFLAKELDRELQDEYSIVLTLTDSHYSDHNYVTQSFLLLVEDINDNVPSFLPYQNAIEIPEGSAPGGSCWTSLPAVEATPPRCCPFASAHRSCLYASSSLDLWTCSKESGINVVLHEGEETTYIFNARKLFVKSQMV